MAERINQIPDIMLEQTVKKLMTSGRHAYFVILAQEDPLVYLVFHALNADAVLFSLRKR
jgi:hypothetical protein